MISKNLSAATTKAIILGILKHRKNYGYLILRNIKEISGGRIEWSDGMLYPVLHRLENDGFIRSEWKMSEESRPRKYYMITNAGRRELINEKEQWRQINSVLLKIWKLNP
ncbi:MAG: PadR family transcriptional regulator [Saprospiraceae bacterium]|nr:PadR family transcriptional regulator [Saprospiraceae bacterium]